MRFDKLFTIIDSLIGDVATFKGLTFSFEHGILIVDMYETGYEDDFLFVCDFIPRDEEEEPVSFAAKGIVELKDQLEYYILQ